jgi:hypothetical protein
VKVQPLDRKIATAWRHGRWPVICWTEDAEPWAILRYKTDTKARRFIDLQHRRGIFAVLVTRAHQGEGT